VVFEHVLRELHGIRSFASSNLHLRCFDFEHVCHHRFTAKSVARALAPSSADAGIVERMEIARARRVFMSVLDLCCRLSQCQCSVQITAGAETRQTAALSKSGGRAEIQERYFGVGTCWGVSPGRTMGMSLVPGRGSTITLSPVRGGLRTPLHAAV
jgi:hypothetical protein